MIKNWQKPTKNVITIERYMELELPISRVGQSNQLSDTVSVEVINADNLGIWIEVGRLQNGYHTGITYAVPTGGGLGGVWRGRVGIPDKLDALRAALRIAAQSHWITRHDGALERIEAAIRDLDKYKAKQLTLF